VVSVFAGDVVNENPEIPIKLIFGVGGPRSVWESREQYAIISDDFRTVAVKHGSFIKFSGERPYLAENVELFVSFAGLHTWE
jgi:hypothetical protein